MATKFTSLDDNKEGKKTVFTKAVMKNLTINGTISQPDDFDNILHIGFDKYYGDVFKCWCNKDNVNEFIIYFGTAGDEFKK